MCRDLCTEPHAPTVPGSLALRGGGHAVREPGPGQALGPGPLRAQGNADTFTRARAGLLRSSCSVGGRSGPTSHVSPGLGRRPWAALAALSEPLSPWRGAPPGPALTWPVHNSQMRREENAHGTKACFLHLTVIHAREARKPLRRFTRKAVWAGACGCVSTRACLCLRPRAAGQPPLQTSRI